MSVCEVEWSSRNSTFEQLACGRGSLSVLREHRPDTFLAEREVQNLLARVQTQHPKARRQAASNGREPRPREVFHPERLASFVQMSWEP